MIGCTSFSLSFKHVDSIYPNSSFVIFQVEWVKFNLNSDILLMRRVKHLWLLLKMTNILDDTDALFVAILPDTDGGESLT